MQVKLAGFGILSLFLIMWIPVYGEVTEFSIEKNDFYEIKAKAFGETLDLKKHNFKVEIKAPTFYDMVIRNDDEVYMKFLLDL